jgi:hypothetical protein
VSIDTTYRGASAEVIETRVTQIIEDQVAGLEGIVKLTSTSRDERSTVVIEFSLNRNVDEAANDVRDRVGRVAAQLPPEADPPQIAKADSDTQPVMWLTFTSDRHSTLELTDIAERMLVDRFSVVEGVARVQIGGARRYAMRVWLDREAMAARGITSEDITAALRRENVELPAGRLESTQREFTLRTRTGLTRAEDFAALVIERGADGNFVRLGDVAQVRIGAEDERSAARANLVPAISLGISQQSKANTVEVSRGIRAAMDEVMPSLPEGVEIAINFDRAAFIEASMLEVVKALAFALSLVLLVIYLFLGNVRATLVPAVTIPICIIATFSVMAFFGYSINVLILLGLVLAIGLVVDDAIVVLENIWRRVEEGEPPLLAAVNGSREIGFAVIATTLVLVSVFLPISFIQGNVGRLFREFGVAVAAAVGISSLVALTLIPMLSSKLFKADQERGWLTRQVERGFKRLGNFYRRLLQAIVPQPWAVLAIALLVTVAAAGLFRALPSEYAPREDRGIFFTLITAPPGASLEFTESYAHRMEEILMRYVDSGEARRVLLRVPGGWGGGGGVDSARAIVLLEDWDQRERSVEEIANEVRGELSELPGVQARVITPAGLGVRGADRPCRWCSAAPSTRSWRPGATSSWKRPKASAGCAGSTPTTRSASRRCAWSSTATARPSSACRSRTSAARSRPCSARAPSRPSSTGAASTASSCRVSPRAAPPRPTSRTSTCAPRPAACSCRSATSSASPSAPGPRSSGASTGCARSRSRRARAHRLARPGARRVRGARAQHPPPGHPHQLGRRVARVQGVRRLAVRHLRHGADRRVPRARGAVRELPPPAGDHVYRAARHHGGAAGAVGLRRHHQRLQPDRPDHARRARGQERRADRRVCQPAARSRHGVRGGRDRGLRDPAAPRAHDQRLHRDRRAPAAARRGRRLREPPGGGHRRGVRHGADDRPHAGRRAGGVFRDRAQHEVARARGAQAG